MSTAIYEHHQREISDRRHVCFSIIDLFFFYYISLLDSFYKLIAKTNKNKEFTIEKKKRPILKLGTFIKICSHPRSICPLTLTFFFFTSFFIVMRVNIKKLKTRHKHLSSCLRSFSSLIILHPHP